MINLYRSRYHHNSKPGIDKAEFLWGLWILFLGSRGIVGCWIEILGVIGDDNCVLFEFRLAQIFRIGYGAYSLSCSLISLNIGAILWNISHASLGSLWLTLLLLILDTFTNHVLLFFLCVSRPSSLGLTCLITERVYLDAELAVISLVDCHALTDLMTICSSAPNVLTSMGNPWAPSISIDTTTNTCSYELR